MTPDRDPRNQTVDEMRHRLDQLTVDIDAARRQIEHDGVIDLDGNPAETHPAVQPGEPPTEVAPPG